MTTIETTMIVGLALGTLAAAMSAAEARGGVGGGGFGGRGLAFGARHLGGFGGHRGGWGRSGRVFRRTGYRGVQLGCDARGYRDGQIHDRWKKFG